MFFFIRTYFIPFLIFFLTNLSHAKQVSLPEDFYSSGEFYCSTSAKEIGDSAAHVGSPTEFIENGTIYGSTLLGANEPFCSILNIGRAPNAFHVMRKCEDESSTSIDGCGWFESRGFQTKEGHFKLYAVNGKLPQKLKKTPRIVKATARGIILANDTARKRTTQTSQAVSTNFSSLTLSEVVDLQWSLKQLGYYKGRLDGVLSVNVRAVYQAYQQQNEPNNPALDRAAVDLLGKRQRLTTIPANSLNTVRAIQEAQKALTAIGFQRSITGVVDARMISSLNRFQQQYGFPITRRLDAFTYDRLFKAAQIWMDVTTTTTGQERHPFADHALAFLHEGLRPVNPIGNASIYALRQNKILPTANNQLAQLNENRPVLTPRTANNVERSQTQVSQTGQLNFRQLGGLKGLRMQGNSVVMFNKLFNTPFNGRYSEEQILPQENFLSLLNYKINPDEIDKPFLNKNTQGTLIRRNLKLLGQDARSYADIGLPTNTSGKSSKSNRKQGAFRLKGKNEFEFEQSLRSYRKHGVPRIRSALPQFPLKIIEIVPIEMGKYDFDRQAFKLGFNSGRNLYTGLSLVHNRGFLSRNYIHQNNIDAPYTFDFRNELPIPESQAELFRDKVRFASNRGFAIDSFEQGKINVNRLNELLNKYSDTNYSKPDKGVSQVFIALELEVLGIETPSSENKRLTLSLKNAAAYSDVALKDRLDWFPVSTIITNVLSRDQIAVRQQLNQNKKKSRLEYITAYNLQDTDRDVLRVIAAEKAKRWDILEQDIRAYGPVKQANEFDREGIFQKEIQRFKGLKENLPAEIWFQGFVQFGEYDIAQGEWRVLKNGIRIKNTDETFSFSERILGTVINKGAVKNIRVPKALAERITREVRRSVRPVRARFKVKPINVDILQPIKTRNFQRLKINFALEEIVLIHGNNKKGVIVARHPVDVAYKPPSAEDLLPSPPDLLGRANKFSWTGSARKPYFNQQLAIAHALAQKVPQLDDKALAQLIGLQWLHDRADINTRLPGELFKDDDPVPTNLGLKKTSKVIVAAYRELGKSMPKKVTLRVNRDFSGRLLRPTLASNQSKRAHRSFCDFLDIKGVLGNRDIFNFSPADVANMTNEFRALASTGTEIEPAFIKNVVLEFANRPENCKPDALSAREISRSLTGSLGDSRSPFVIRYVIDALPTVPIHSGSKTNYLEIEAEITNVDVGRPSGSGFPPIVVNLSLKSLKQGRLTNLGLDDQSFEVHNLFEPDALIKKQAERKAGSENFDIIGLKVGMSLDQADMLLQTHMPDATVFDHVPEPNRRNDAFQTARLYRSKDGVENIILLHEASRGVPKILGLARHVWYGENKLSKNDALSALVSKYGNKYHLHEQTSQNTHFYFGDRHTSFTEGSNSSCHVNFFSAPVLNWKTQEKPDEDLISILNKDNHNGWSEAHDRKSITLPNVTNSLFWSKPPRLENENCGVYLSAHHRTFNGDSLRVFLINFELYWDAFQKPRDTSSDFGNQSPEAGIGPEIKL